MDSPYSDLPANRYWKTGVADQSPFTIENLYKRKFDISGRSIATAGSCFAQHIARNLRSRGFSVLDLEPPPPAMSEATAKKFGYFLYSARYGNIYLVRQLLQLTKEAFGLFEPACSVWSRGGRFYDALRPSVEPNGFASPEEVIAHRKYHLSRVKQLFTKADIMVFTLGLTEGWQHTESGTVYPSAPGTIAGYFDASEFSFKNFTHREILDDFKEFYEFVKGFNSNIKYILTVSPVPLTATATPNHVLVASTYSKSVLRSAAGELAAEYEDIDYFPSYEIISSHFSRGIFYSPNLRTVEQAGVDNVMKIFFSQHPTVIKKRTTDLSDESSDKDVVCEEEILDAFA